ncbi:Eco47II family restriction endonuclease [Aliivibrio wodanis]|uniref:Eco47II family restriction endonuclease n=1 Tax=Aliivibrio wodanis TaxID=80852 RepID=UPI00406BFCEE
MKAFDRNNLKEAIRSSIKRVYEAQISELDLYRNTLDCFSASIDSVVQGISLDEWLKQEKERQIQKTKQNAIGTLHEEVLGSIKGVENLAVGQLIDIISHDKKIIAEIKNKHNTTKGNHKVAIYDDLASALTKNPGYVGFYVEILPKGKKSYNIPFSPSDNKVKEKRPPRDDIRQIDGRSFYELLTGNPDAINELYEELPALTAEIVNEEFGTDLRSDIVSSSEAFSFNFNEAYAK